MSQEMIWITMALMGTVTFLTRLSFIGLWGRFNPPEIVIEALRYVPPAVLAAIILPELLMPGGGPLDVSFQNERLIAGVVAALAALLSRNMLLTIVAGMAALAFLKFALPALY